VGLVVTDDGPVVGSVGSGMGVSCVASLIRALGRESHASVGASVRCKSSGILEKKIVNHYCSIKGMSLGDLPSYSFFAIFQCIYAFQSITLSPASAN